MKTYFCCVLMKFQNSHLLIQSQNIQGSILQLVASPPADPGVTSLILVQSHTSIGIDHEIISIVILLLLLIQEGLLSVTSESTYRKYLLTCPRKSVVR